MCRAIATCILSETTLFRDGLAQILSRSSFRVVAQASTDSFGALQCSKEPKLFIVCSEKSGPLDQGLFALVNEIRSGFPEAHVVMVGPDTAPKSILSAFQYGVHAYLPSSINSDALVKSLEVVLSGVLVMPGSCASSVAAQHGEDARLMSPSDQPRLLSPPADSPPLSARELLILKSLVNGDSNKLIARQLDIAEATVKVHVKAILRKVRVRNRTQAAIWAINVGLPASGANGSYADVRGGFAAPMIALNS